MTQACTGGFRVVNSQETTWDMVYVNLTVTNSTFGVSALAHAPHINAGLHEPPRMGCLALQSYSLLGRALAVCAPQISANVQATLTRCHITGCM